MPRPALIVRSKSEGVLSDALNALDCSIRAGLVSSGVSHPTVRRPLRDLRENLGFFNSLCPLWHNLFHIIIRFLLKNRHNLV